MRPRGGVVTQRSAKPCTPVQFWSWPPSTSSGCCGEFFRKSFRYAAAPGWMERWPAGGPERACEITPWAEGSVSVSSPEVFPPKLDRRNHPAATVILRQCTLVGQSPNRSEFAAARSAGGVPALGKRQQRPGQPIVVGGFRRLIEYRLIAQEVLLGRGRNGRSYGIQQQIEFSFAHRALLRFERVGSQNSFVSGLSE
jgi:hypothetical protein